jgi:hypothetical protein
MSANRNLYVRIRDDAGNERGLKVDANGAIAVTGGGGGTQYAEDAASVSGDTGTLALVVRKDTPGNLSGLDGDYEALQMSAGRLWTSATIDAALPAGANAIGKLAANSGVDIGDVDVTSVIPGTGATNLGKAEDAAHASGDVGVQLLAVLTATPVNRSGTDGDYEPLQISAGRLWASATIDAALPAGANAIGKLAANSGVDIGDVDILSIAAGDNNIGNVDVLSQIPGTGATNLGKAEDAAHTTGDTGVMALAVSNEANTARAADGDYLPIATDTEGNVRMVGNRDHDAVDAGEVVGAGGRAIAHGTNPTAVAAADRTAWYFNRAGVPFVLGGHPNIVAVEAAYTTAQTDVAVVTVAGGLKIVVTSIGAYCDNANTVDVGLRMGFGATTTPTTTGVVLTHPGIAKGSGVERGTGIGILGVGADGEDLRITSEVPTTGSLRVLVTYFTIES